jgi:hypothetical protein
VHMEAVDHTYGSTLSYLWKHLVILLEAPSHTYRSTLIIFGLSIEAEPFGQ